jgi:outer membrane protein insertion porin family
MMSLRLSLTASLLAALGLIASPLWAQSAAAPPVLRVDNIRVEGLQRVSEGTVYNYLPVNIGDRLSPQRVREAIRALYDTGFFRDVELRWEEGTLVVAVLERPSIESFSISGNKDIKTEDS